MLKVMAEYECWPVWIQRDRVFANVDPAMVGLDPALCSRLLEWSAVYDATLNRDNPVSSGFKSGVQQKRFVSEGRTLARQVAADLGDGVHVIYRPDDSRILESIKRE